eukprot:2588325-Prymnesium_polylepis.1
MDSGMNVDASSFDPDESMTAVSSPDFGHASAANVRRTSCPEKSRPALPSFTADPRPCNRPPLLHFSSRLDFHSPAALRGRIHMPRPITDPSADARASLMLPVPRPPPKGRPARASEIICR